MRVVQNQDRLIFEAGRFKFVGDFTESEFHERFLRSVIAARPFAQDRIGNGEFRSVFRGQFFVRNLLRECASLIE